MRYLGGLFSESGGNSAEIRQKIGFARSDFAALQQVWSHVFFSPSENHVLQAVNRQQGDLRT